MSLSKFESVHHVCHRGPTMQHGQECEDYGSELPQHNCPLTKHPHGLLCTRIMYCVFGRRCVRGMS